MLTIGQKLRGSLTRTIPACVMQAQAVAFNMFLAFFPMLLFALGLLTTNRLQSAVKEIPERLRYVLPPGTERVLIEYLGRHGTHSWSWAWLGFGGTLLAGTQVMIGLMDGFRIIAGETERPSFLKRQLRALLLLCLTLAPWVAAVTLTIFGKQARTWLIHRIGLPGVVQGLSVVGYVVFVLLLALAVLVVVYRLGRPKHRGWRAVLPGAGVATLLWWVLDVAFGWYVRHMPYGMVYGGLAAAIGLLLWMYMTAMVVFFGAAYNAESRQYPREPWVKPRKPPPLKSVSFRP
jgi:membrane protein